jgi:long-chain acyl-CoA synthetase
LLRLRWLVEYATVKLQAMNNGTLPSKFLHAIDTWPSPRAQMFSAKAGWQHISSDEFLRRTAGLSQALFELGIKPGDRVGLFAANRPEWHTADFAINGNGAITVPVYFKESPERTAYILNHSEARVVFLAGRDQLISLLAIRNELPQLEHIVVADAGEHLPPDCLRYETLIGSAGGAEVASYRMRASQVLPGQLASIIYTSGTTGEPKGVMLTHANFCSNTTDVGCDFALRSQTDVAISFLPLAHVYGRTLDYLYLFQGVPIAYVDVVENVAQALKEIKPTVMAAVPRVFEKLYARVMEQGTAHPGIKKRIFMWAIGVAERAAPWRCGDRNASPWLKVQWVLADKLVYAKIREGTGGRLRIVSSGGAPLSKSLAEFFWSVGVPIYQGYGLTETSPIVSSNFPRNRVGSSGLPIPHCEIKIADDGEILVRGPMIMQGYYKRPDATREAIDQDGWFHSGDIGYVDQDRYLFVTDRKKDLLKTSAGKYVAPQPIENALKTSPYILNVMVVGDRRKFIVALVVPNCKMISARAAEQGIAVLTGEEVAAHPFTRTLIHAEIQRLTANLAQYETIKRFALLPGDFTFDNGALTFTMKLKRRVVEDQYRGMIESLYADIAEPRPVIQD